MLLAVSGGLDSMALLHFFQSFVKKKFHITFAVAHFEHGIHSHSIDTQQRLAEFCKQENYRFYTHSEDIPQKLAESHKSSLEAVAREYRYQWLGKIAEQEQYHQIVTAHTASDQCELIFMRLARGGISGLAGMKAHSIHSNRQLIRPFLKCTRTQLESYIKYYNVSYIDDPTNQELDFFRNRVRHQMIPFLLQENPRLEANLTELSELWTAEQDYLHLQAQNWFEAHCSLEPLIEIPIKALNDLHLALQRRVIRLALTRWQGDWKVFTSRHIESIRELMEARPGKLLHLPKGLQVMHSTRETLVFDS